MHIKHLILKGNPISTFDPSIFMKMKRLERLYLDDSDEACWSTKGKWGKVISWIKIFRLVEICRRRIEAQAKTSSRLKVGTTPNVKNVNLYTLQL